MADARADEPQEPFDSGSGDEDDLDDDAAERWIEALVRGGVDPDIAETLVWGRGDATRPLWTPSSGFSPAYAASGERPPRPINRYRQGWRRLQ